MEKIIISFILPFLFAYQLIAQDNGRNLGERDGYPFMDYWPVLLLPIFVFVFYRFWKKRKK